MKLLKNGQSGQALVMALILMVVGSLIIVPILNLAGTSLKYHQVVQRSTLETYAADSGVDYALCELGNDLAGYETEVLQASFTTNDRSVDVTAEYMGNDTFKITSIATTDSNSSTTIESYIHTSTYPDFFNNAITSKGDIIIRPDGSVYGDVQYEGELDNKGTIYGDAIQAPVDDWPLVEDLSSFYWVDDVISESTIDISSGTVENPYLIGPGHTYGNLTITGTGVAALNGTLYVQGSLTVMPGSDLMLNLETIWSNIDVTFQPGTDLYGPGCIIAAGDIAFQPNLMTGEEAYVLLMSLEGAIQFQPNNDFYGSVAGNVDVTLQPGTGLYWTEPDPGLEYPECPNLEIISYEIK